MTTPSILPVGYAGDSSDYRHVKADRSGAVRLVTGAVSVPSGTATTTIVGLFPFQKGAKLSYGGAIYSAALGTSVTAGVGIVYDDNVTNTNDQTAYVSASTVTAAGGIIRFDQLNGTTLATAGRGWVVATIGGATTGSTGNLSFNIGVVYDISGVTG